MFTRRGFIGSTLAAGAVTFGAMHPARSQSPRKRLIVDAQIHLWKAESADWKWIPGMKPQLPEPFTVERALPLLDEAGIDRAVVVPPSWPGDRNDYALEAARRYPNRFAVMGRITLQDPKSADLLPKASSSIRSESFLSLGSCFSRAARNCVRGISSWKCRASISCSSSSC